MDKVLRLAVAVASAVIGLALVAGPAVAHDELVGSSPADDTTVLTAPAEVVLAFNNPVQTDFGQVAVLDETGAHHEEGDPEVVGRTVTQAVGTLGAGVYEVSYRVGSSDGHPISGTLTFTVTGAATTPEATPGSAGPTPSTSSDPHEGMDHDDHVSPTAEPVEVTDTGDGTSALLLGAGGVAAVAALAAVVFFAMGGRRPREPDGGEGAETGPS
ncbi:MAG: copper resistance CopC family protein [Acidimicrobiales bacterium]